MLLISSLPCTVYSVTLNFRRSRSCTRVCTVRYAGKSSTAAARWMICTAPYKDNSESVQRIIYQLGIGMLVEVIQKYHFSHVSERFSNLVLHRIQMQARKSKYGFRSDKSAGRCKSLSTCHKDGALEHGVNVLSHKSCEQSTTT